jgi:peptide/nickel transport system substrate-binding protein
VSTAIDYKGIVAALQGGVVRTPGIIPAGLVGYDASAPEYSNNLTKAKSYLKASGYSGKKESLTLTYTQGDSDEQLAAQLIQSELAPLGITVKVEALQWATPTRSLGSPTSTWVKRSRTLTSRTTTTRR